MLSDEKLWECVQKRDHNYDGKFYYGVITTGIFCNPSCKTKLALRKNIQFFSSTIEAEKTGLRACKKCNPKNIKNQIKDVIYDLCRTIESQPNKILSLAEIARKSGYSSSHIQKAFTQIIGISPKAYMEGLRQKNLKKELHNQKNITDAIHQSGFNSTSRVYEKLSSNIGMTPKQYRKGGQGLVIHYEFALTSLGHTLIAATDKGICFLQFGDHKKNLLDALFKEFSSAQITQMSDEGQLLFKKWVNALNSYLENKKKLQLLPTDIRGTAFQIIVWRYLQSIPAGEVRSYTEVAQAIGKPKAVRAVASACAKNTIGLLIPCHRVIRGDGSLAGYRWGIERKRALLDIEQNK